MQPAADSEQPPEHDKVASVRRLALVFTAAECSSVGSVRETQFQQPDEDMSPEAHLVKLICCTTGRALLTHCWSKVVNIMRQHRVTAYTGY